MKRNKNLPIFNDYLDLIEEISYCQKISFSEARELVLDWIQFKKSKNDLEILNETLDEVMPAAPKSPYIDDEDDDEDEDDEFDDSGIESQTARIQKGGTVNAKKILKNWFGKFDFGDLEIISDNNNDEVCHIYDINLLYLHPNKKPFARFCENCSIYIDAKKRKIGYNAVEFVWNDERDCLDIILKKI